MRRNPALPLTSFILAAATVVYAQTTMTTASTMEVVSGPTGPTGPTGASYISGLYSDGQNGSKAADQAAAATAKSENIRSEEHWFDVRSKGAVCDGNLTLNVWSGTDDTAAFKAAGAHSRHQSIEIPPFLNAACSINPGPSSGSAAVILAENGFILHGQTPSASVLRDETNTSTPVSNAPLLQIGTGASLQNGTVLRDFGLTGAYDVSYPNGVLEMFQNNISTVDNLHINLGPNSANSFGIKNSITASQYFQEMRFHTVSVYGNSTTLANPNNTGVFLQAPEGNIDFLDSNIEGVTIGMDFSGINGTPILNYVGGHIEQIPRTGSGSGYIGGVAFRIRQAQLHLTGTDVESGMIYLDSSTINSNIEPAVGATGWYASIVDNGVGNQIHVTSASNSVRQTLNLDGSEQYKTLTLTSDPLMFTGTSAWTKSGTTANVTLTAVSETAPGAKAGQGMQIASTDGTSGAYITTQALPQSSAVEVVLVLRWGGGQSAVTVKVIDNQSSSTIYSASVQPTMALPTKGGFSAYRVLRLGIPTSASATTWNLQVVPGAGSAVTVDYAGVNPSSTSMASAVASNGAVCTIAGSYTDSCAIPGQAGGTAAKVVFTPTAPTYSTGAFTRLVVTTAADAVAPECIIGNMQVYFLPNITWEYNFPTGYWPSNISCRDAYGPSSDPNDMVISQATVVPIQQGLVVPITTPDDGKYVTGITPDGVQQRRTVNPADRALASPVEVSAAGGAETGNSGDQPLNTWTGITLAAGKCMRLTGATVRVAGSASNTFKIIFGGTVSNGAVKGGTTVASWSYSNSATSTTAVFHALVCNNAGSTTSQFSFMDPVFNNTSPAAGAASLTSSASTATASKVYFTFDGASTEEFTPKGAVLELLQ